MTRNTFHSFLLAGISLAFLPGCDSQMAKMQSDKARMTDNWNQARVQIVCQLAEQQYEVGDYDKCEETLDQGFVIGYPYSPLHRLAAKVAMEKGQLEIASQHLKAATEINSNEPETYYLLGEVYQRWQNNQAAHDYYSKAFALRPSEPLYLLAEVEMKLELGKNDEAQKLLEDKLIYFEESAAIRAALARLATIKGDYETACRYYHEAIILSPDDLILKQDMAEAYFFAGKFSDALPILESLRQSDDLADKSTVLALLGDSYMELHRPVDARNCFDQLTQDYPYEIQAWLDLGKAALQVNDLMQAQVAAHKALKADPKNVQAMILAALVQQKKGQWDQARQILQQAQAVEPHNSTVLCLLGLSIQKSGQTSQAKDYYNQALAINPKDAWAQELLASAK